MGRMGRLGGAGAWQMATAATAAALGKLWASSEKQVDRQLVLTCSGEGHSERGEGGSNLPMATV